MFLLQCINDIIIEKHTKLDKLNILNIYKYNMVKSNYSISDCLTFGLVILFLLFFIEYEQVRFSEVFRVCEYDNSADIDIICWWPLAKIKGTISWKKVLCCITISNSKILTFDNRGSPKAKIACPHSRQLRGHAKYSFLKEQLRENEKVRETVLACSYAQHR